MLPVNNLRLLPSAWFSKGMQIVNRETVKAFISGFWNGFTWVVCDPGRPCGRLVGSRLRGVARFPRRTSDRVVLCVPQLLQMTSKSVSASEDALAPVTLSLSPVGIRVSCCASSAVLLLASCMWFSETRKRVHAAVSGPAETMYRDIRHKYSTVRPDLKLSLKVWSNTFLSDL